MLDCFVVTMPQHHTVKILYLLMFSVKSPRFSSSALNDQSKPSQLMNNKHFVGLEKKKSAHL